MNHPGSGARNGYRSGRLLPTTTRSVTISEIPLSTLSHSTSRTPEEMEGDSKIPLASQVGGHAGVTTSEDGSFLYKPALAHEVSFYESLTSDPVFATLKPYIPKFYGVLKYQGKLEEGDLKITHEPRKEEKDKCLHLERGWKSPPYLQRPYI